MIMTIYIGLNMHILWAHKVYEHKNGTNLGCPLEIMLNKGVLRASEWVKLRVVPCMTNRILNF